MYELSCKQIKMSLLALKLEISTPFACASVVFAANRIRSYGCDVLLTVLCRSCVGAVLWSYCGCVALCVVVVLWLCFGFFLGVKGLKCCRCVEGVKCKGIVALMYGINSGLL